MEQEKNKNNGVVVILLLLLLAAVGYIAYDKLLNSNVSNQGGGDTPTKAEETATTDANTNNNTESKESVKYFYDVKDLKVKALPEYQVFDDISNKANVVESLNYGTEKHYNASLDIAGKVTIRKYGTDTEKAINGTLNVADVIDILQFSVPASETEQLLYLLTKNGDVYSYRIGDVENNSFNATKVENVSNVKKIFISTYAKENAGSSWALFAITGDNDCVMLKGSSV